MPAVHDYKCRVCSYYFEAFFESMDEAEETHPCPSCGRKSDRQLSRPRFKIAKSMPEKASRLKDKSFANQFCEEHIKRSKKRIGEQKFSYSRYHYQPDKDQRKGSARPKRMTDAEVRNKLKVAKHMTIEMHKQAGKLKDLGDHCEI